MIAVFSTGDAAIIVAIITAIGAPIVAMLVRQKKSIDQISTAVNHVSPGEPTLIQRVRDIQADNRDFRQWTHESIKAIALQVGAEIKDPPEEHGPHAGNLDKYPAGGN